MSECLGDRLELSIDLCFERKEKNIMHTPYNIKSGYRGSKLHGRVSMLRKRNINTYMPE